MSPAYRNAAIEQTFSFRSTHEAPAHPPGRRRPGMPRMLPSRAKTSYAGSRSSMYSKRRARSWSRSFADPAAPYAIPSPGDERNPRARPGQSRTDSPTPPRNREFESPCMS